jgi:hypothetical protein
MEVSDDGVPEMRLDEVEGMGAARARCRRQSCRQRHPCQRHESRVALLVPRSVDGDQTDVLADMEDRCQPGARDTPRTASSVSAAHDPFG